jgi:lipid-A-disaccharide synthase
MMDLVRRWRTERPEVQWVLPVAPTLTDAEVAEMLGDLPVTRVGSDRTYAARAYADAALVASGTATLETAILGTPFAIVYKLHPLTYGMAKRMVKLPHFGLANVVAGREVAPELVQAEVSAEGLAPILAGLLKSGTRQARAQDFAEIRARLGEPGAAGRVADHILSSLEVPCDRSFPA